MTHEFAYPRVRQIAPRAHGVPPRSRTARPAAPTSDPSPSRIPSTEVWPSSIGRSFTAAGRQLTWREAGT